MLTVFCDCTSLNEVRLGGCVLEPEDVLDVPEAMRPNLTLDCMFLHRDSITDDGAWHFGNAFHCIFERKWFRCHMTANRVAREP